MNQIYDDNQQLLKLKNDINNPENWKAVKESFRAFYACKPGPGYKVLNKLTGAIYITSERYPWVISGITDELYVDSDDLNVEDINGLNVTYKYKNKIPGKIYKDSENLLINNKCTWKRFRVAGGKHQDTLKGVQIQDLQNCRKYLAFYLNPNKYDENALNQFTLTMNNEVCQMTVYNKAVQKSKSGLGNFLVCKESLEFGGRPDFNMIFLVSGDEFIQRFNAKPFKLKKIDEAIDKYNREELLGNRHVKMPKQEIVIITENDKLLESRRNTESKLEEKEDFLRKLSDELFNAQIKPFLREVSEQNSNFKEQRRNTSGKNYRLIVRPNGYDITKQKYLCATGRDIPEELRNKYKQIDMYTVFKCQNDLVAFKMVEIVITRQFNDLDSNNKLSVKSILTLKNKKTGKKKILSFVENYSGQNAVKNMVTTQQNSINKGFKWMSKKLSDMEA